MHLSLQAGTMDITLETEIRHLPYNIISGLAEIVQIGNCWKDVMGVIPKDFSVLNQQTGSNDYPKKYSNENINLVSQVCMTESLNGMEVLIEEWGTSGLIRPNVSNLLSVLERAGQLRAVSFLKDSLFDTNSESDSIDSENYECIKNHIPYSVLKEITSNFCDVPFTDGGNFIGRGGFGVVYKGILNSIEGTLDVAIKRIIDDTKPAKYFYNEIELLQNCTHNNILELVGFSFDGQHHCLVYEYMENGSLLDHLSSPKEEDCLTWNQRLNICEGAAEGICYLHNMVPPLVHRDIKSANILLDKNLNAKIGDFGLVHLGSRGTHSVIQTSAQYGTQTYMAPEAFRGDVSIKMDTFSYGIVLLEILTGLPPYDNDREGNDLLTFIMDYEEEDEYLVDNKAGYIPEPFWKTLFDLAYSCTKDKKWRPSMDLVLSNIKDVHLEIKKLSG